MYLAFQTDLAAYFLAIAWWRFAICFNKLKTSSVSALRAIFLIGVYLTYSCYRLLIVSFVTRYPMLKPSHQSLDRDNANAANFDMVYHFPRIGLFIFLSEMIEDFTVFLNPPVNRSVTNIYSVMA